MTGGVDLPRARETIVATLAAECGCEPAALWSSEVLVCERPDERAPRGPARRYPPREVSFGAASLGRGCVVSASRAVLPQVRAIFAGADRDGAFAPERLARVGDVLAPFGLRVHGPHPRFTCGVETRRPCSVPADLCLRVQRDPAPDRLAALEQARWPHAQLGRAPTRPTTRLALAELAGSVVGVATTCADTEELWQIGIDVDPSAQGRGIGAALTGALTDEALAAGCVPVYYAAAPNLPSIRTALAVGFAPAWVEAFASSRDA